MKIRWISIQTIRSRRVDIRTLLSDYGRVKGSEFEHRVQKLAKKMGLSCAFIASQCKGSHGRLYVGAAFTTMKDRKKELGKGLLVKMCSDLKISPETL